MYESSTESKKRIASNLCMYLMVISAAFYHTDYNIIGLVGSMSGMLAIASLNGLNLSRTDITVLLIGSLIMIGQFFLPQENYFYYFGAFLGVVMTSGSFRLVRYDSNFFFFTGIGLQIAVLAIMFLDGDLGANIFKNPNAAAAVAISFFAVTVCRTTTTLPKFLVSSAIYLPAAFLTESRGAVLFYIAVIGFYLILRTSKWVAIGAYIIFAINAILWTSGSNFHQDLLVAISGNQDISFFGRSLFASRERDVLWNLTITSFNQEWTGVGLGNSQKILAPFGFDISPHNLYLRVFVDGGYPMLIFTIFLLLSFAVRTTARLNLAVYLAVLTRNLFESALPFGLSSQSYAILIPFLMCSLTLSKAEISRCNPRH